MRSSLRTQPLICTRPALSDGAWWRMSLWRDFHREVLHCTGLPKDVTRTFPVPFAPRGFDGRAL